MVYNKNTHSIKRLRILYIQYMPARQQGILLLISIF